MRSGNPALSEKMFEHVRTYGSSDEVMTLDGTVNKIGLLLFCVVLTSCWTWYKVANAAAADFSAVSPYMWIGLIGGFIVAIVTCFKPTWAPITAPIYALLEGLFIGSISAYLEMQFPGIVLQAIGLTFGVCLAMLLAYKSRLLQATDSFKRGVIAATGGIFLVYLASIILGLFGVQVPYIHGSGIIGILFSVFVVTIAALNLVLDFDLIEQGVEQGAPKYMEWYGAFALMVTLVWLYIEILRLLAKLRSD